MVNNVVSPAHHHSSDDDDDVNDNDDDDDDCSRFAISGEALNRRKAGRAEASYQTALHNVPILYSTIDVYCLGVGLFLCDSLM